MPSIFPILLYSFLLSYFFMLSKLDTRSPLYNYASIGGVTNQYKQWYGYFFRERWMIFMIVLKGRIRNIDWSETFPRSVHGDDQWLYVQEFHYWWKSQSILHTMPLKLMCVLERDRDIHDKRQDFLFLLLHLEHMWVIKMEGVFHVLITQWPRQSMHKRCHAPNFGWTLIWHQSHSHVSQRGNEFFW